jgi:Protein HRI1
MSLLPQAGGWRRDGIAVGDEPLRETQDVMWLQVGDDYADMRLGPDKRWAFAGVTTVNGTRVTWTHVVETEGDNFEDTGEMVAIPGGFAERGNFHDGRPYLELWRDVSGPITPARSAVAGEGTVRVVRLGERALWVTPTGAVRLLLVDGAWSVDAVVDTQPEGVAAFVTSGGDCPALFLNSLQISYAE